MLCHVLPQRAVEDATTHNGEQPSGSIRQGMKRERTIVERRFWFRRPVLCPPELRARMGRNLQCSNTLARSGEIAQPGENSELSVLCP
jgi:hypothetical protein